MLAMLFGDESKLIQLSKEMNEKSNYIVDVGNINSPKQVSPIFCLISKQIVLSGHKEGLIIAESLALQRKYCKKTKFLDILYPFHSSILTPCAPIFKEYLESIPLHDGKIDILSNYTSKPVFLFGMRIEVVDDQKGRYYYKLLFTNQPFSAMETVHPVRL